jgi:hypothetical protein
MSERNAVVAVYGAHIEAEGAVKELQLAGLDMRTLSIVGMVITRQYEERLYATYGRPPYWLHEAEHKPPSVLSGV